MQPLEPQGQRVQWLLAELETRTAGRLSEESQQSLLDEVASHLDAAIRARIELGSEPEQAELDAVRSFGSPDAYFTELLAVHENPLRRIKPWLQVGRPDRPTLVSFCAACVWFPIYGLFDLQHSGILWLGTVGPVLVAAFAYFSFRARRVQILSIGAATLGAYFVSILVFSTLWLDLANHGVDRETLIPVWKASAARQIQLQGFTAMDRGLADLNHAVSMHYEQMSPDQIAHLPMRDRSLLFRIIGWPHSQVTHLRISAWRAGADAWMQGMRDVREDSLRKIAAIDAARKSLPLGDFVGNFWRYLGLAGLCFACGSVLNFFCMCLGSIADWAKSVLSRTRLA